MSPEADEVPGPLTSRSTGAPSLGDPLGTHRKRLGEDPDQGLRGKGRDVTQVHFVGGLRCPGRRRPLCLALSPLTRPSVAIYPEVLLDDLGLRHLAFDPSGSQWDVPPTLCFRGCVPSTPVHPEPVRPGFPDDDTWELQTGALVTPKWLRVVPRLPRGTDTGHSRVVESNFHSLYV